MLGLRVLNHLILPTLKPQENSLAADKQNGSQLWALSLAMDSPMGCWQVPHQHKLHCCSDRKRLSQSAGCSDEFWESSLARIAFLVPTPPSPYSVTLHARNKTLGMWAMQSCSSKTPVQTTNTGHSFLHRASSEPLHPTPPWPQLPVLHTRTPALWAQKSRNKHLFSCHKHSQGPAKTISRWQNFAAPVNTLPLYDAFNH